jgi:hypothetical protein
MSSRGKTDKAARHQEGLFQRMCDRYNKSEKYHKEVEQQVDFVTMTCQRYSQGPSYKKGHHKKLSQEPKDKYQVPTQLELALIQEMSPRFLSVIPDECKKHFIRLSLLDPEGFHTHRNVQCTLKSDSLSFFS